MGSHFFSQPDDGKNVETLRNQWPIAAVLVVEAALLPWTGHAYDVTAFLSHAERVYLGHVPAPALWPFGSVSLALLLASQLPMLFLPQLWDLLPLRIFLLKLPAWLADVATAAIVRASTTDRDRADAWALRYLIDPAVVFVTVFHGQNDALSNVCAVGGIALMLAGRYEFAGLALGLGTGTKFYPAAFVPLLVVATYKNASALRAGRAFGAFAITAAATLLPVLAGRAGSVFAAYRNNSFGPQGGVVSIASLWGLIPHAAASGALPVVEQLAAVAIPVALACIELRHVPGKRDVARTAMISAMSIVLLNPGTHPPFYLWIAGPLVLYAAVAGDGIVSLAGLVLSCSGVATQFCQEGSDEYFLLNFGPPPHAGALQCLAPPPLIQTVALAAAVTVVLTAYRRDLFGVAALEVCRRWAQRAAAVLFIAFAISVTVEAVSAAATPPGGTYHEQERAVNTFAIDPVVTRSNGRCTLTFSAVDIVVWAGNPFAARFADASLGYTLYSTERMTIRGRTLSLDAFPSRYENIDVRTVNERTVRITREFDVSSLLRPYRDVETFEERPCSLIAENPLLLYRFDLRAAQAAAASQPLWKRMQVFTRDLAP